MGINPIVALQAAMAAVTAVYLAGWAAAVRGLKREGSAPDSPATDTRVPGPTHIGIGALTNFLDTLGIGSFATTTAIFRASKLVPDRVFPGTLNVGHTLPTVAQALIYTTIVTVDTLTLISMITAAVLGAWLGAGVVARWPKRNVQLGMGLALLSAAVLMLMTQLALFPGGGDALGVRGTKLVIALGGNFFLGALMSLGIGLYAPCMILVSLLGMNPTAAFPIMMGSCAFLMPIGSLRFIRERSYSLRAALGLAIGGVPGVLVAAYIVTSLPIVAVRWLVIVVVVYTGITMLAAAFKREPEVVGAPARART
jgi:uncharacterized membrane protein YfcA